MQQELNENDDRFRSKANTLTQLKNKVQNLEGDVQNFAEKEKIQKKMKLCKKRMRWAQVRRYFLMQLSVNQKKIYDTKSQKASFRCWLSKFQSYNLLTELPIKNKTFG